MIRPLAVAALLALALATGASRADADWHVQQPTGPGGFPTDLGPVGDVECWEANRCLLITPGNSGVAAGLFAYDGSSWYRYSTVCGGTEGRIAWVGPDEFWTISDQQVGQATGQAPPSRISLCHFKEGQVVASYGEPVGVPTSYRPMSAAACAGPSNCWFAGERLPPSGENQGAFHLHWDGSSLTSVPSQIVAEDLSDPGRTVSSLAVHEGSFYEAVNVAEGDTPSAAEKTREEEGLGPSLLHRIEAGAASPFKPLFPAEPFDYGGAESAAEMEGFRLTGGAGEPLWAIAGSEGSAAGPMVLRLASGEPTQLQLSDPGPVFEAGDSVRGVAAESGAEAAWVSFRHRGDTASIAPARLARIGADGSVGAEVALPAPGEEVNGEEIGFKGLAGPIACAGPEQCWTATSRGWLFHLGADPAPNTDPQMHVLVTSRPGDNSLPTLPPIELPEDDSGANEGGSDQEEPIIEQLPHRIPALVSKIKQQLVHGTVLEMKFTLREAAHVQLVASRKGKVVAKTPRYKMAKGRHVLHVRLDPKRWPTKIDLQAHALKGKHAK